MINETDKIAATHLGKRVSGSELYNPALLVAVPRAENRRQYEIDAAELPFMGWDVWHAYEFSAMTQNGVPVTRVLKLKYNCNNEFLVESKSLKLYLNSFNMSRYGADMAECLAICKNLIEKDLSEKLKTTVEVAFLDDKSERADIFSNFKNLMDFVDEKALKVEKFNEAPGLIKVEDTGMMTEYYLKFDSLRSNCRVTHQPDFGDAFIYYKSQKHFDEASLIKYLSSFRAEYHFHEECCEMIYKRLYDLLDEDDELLVCCLYTRRGGIDISPARWSKNCCMEDALLLLDLTKFVRNGIKQ